MYTINDEEQAAYIAGDTKTANLLARIAQLESEVLELENEIADTMTLEEWEKRHGPAMDYKTFFEECFQRLAEHYPGPSITSDYDQGIIFEAIEKGEA